MLSFRLAAIIALQEKSFKRTTWRKDVPRSRSQMEIKGPVELALVHAQVSLDVEAGEHKGLDVPR
jgi:hypothetical protein